MKKLVFCSLLLLTTNVSAQDSTLVVKDFNLAGPFAVSAPLSVDTVNVKGEKFDESMHEAVTQIPAPAPEQKGMVIDVVEKGYYLNDKVLRYAKVVVAV